VAELAAVPKVTPKLAQKVYDYFHPPATVAPGEPDPPVGDLSGERQPGSGGGESA
jgi:hypothetical protein